MQTFGIIFVICTSLLVYFVPSIIARVRNHRNFGPVLALNVLTAWTGIGWIIAFVWSLTNQDSI